MQVNLPELAETLADIEFFERERTDRHLLHAAVAPSRNYLTTWRFLDQLRELYGRLPPIIMIDGSTYGIEVGHGDICGEQSNKARYQRCQDMSRWASYISYRMMVHSIIIII